MRASNVAQLIRILTLAALASQVAGAQSLVLTKPARLHTEPSAKSKSLAWLDARDTVYQIESERTNGYVQVRLDTLEGWISGRAVRALQTPLASALSVSAAHHKTCPVGGEPGGSARQTHTDSLKNRTKAVTASDFDNAITLAAILKKGNDEQRFSEDRAAEIDGYVDSVKSGGPETVNCNSPDSADYDTHIELSQVPGAAGPKRVIVEITPRMREIARAQGLNWDTDSIRSQIQHKWVRVTGWLLWDYHHKGNATNTAKPSTTNIWRATAWEVHPITKILVCSGGKATC